MLGRREAVRQGPPPLCGRGRSAQRCCDRRRCRSADLRRRTQSEDDEEAADEDDESALDEVAGDEAEEPERESVA